MAEQVKESNERSCKDIFMLIIFILFWGVYIVVMGIGFSEGDPKRLTYPMDFKGQLCGVDAGVEDCPYLAWIPGHSDAEVCVPNCAGNTTNTPMNFRCYSGEGIAGRVYMDSDREYLNRCIPNSLTEDLQAKVDALGGQKTMADLQASVWVILLCFFLSIVVAFGWLEMIKRWASEMIWASIILMFVVGIAAIAFLFSKYQEASQQDTEFDSDAQNTYLGMGIILVLGLVAASVVVCCLRDRISLTGELMEEAAAAVKAMPQLLVFPIVPLMLTLVFFILWVFAGMYIATAGTIETADGSSRRFNPDETTQGMLGFHVFALIWNLLFIVALADTTVAGAVATWYYTRDKENDLRSPVWTAFTNTLWYNLGSLALGSLILLIVKLISAIFEIIKRMDKDYSSDFGRFCKRVVQFYVHCFEKFISFLTRNALIHVAIYNTSFCDGAKESWKLMTENASTVAAVNVVGDFLLLVCKVFVCAISGLICFLILDRGFDDIEDAATPTMIVVALSFIVGCNFFGTVEMAIDTILVCFCHEEDQVQADASYQPFMSDDLKQFIESQSHLRAKVGDSAAPEP